MVELGDETIADSGNRFNIAGSSGFLTEGFAQGGDVAVEIVFLDRGFRPNGREKLVFGNELAVALDKNAQGFKSLAGERNVTFSAYQPVLFNLQPEGAELIDRAEITGIHRFQKIPRKISSRAKDFDTRPGH